MNKVSLITVGILIFDDVEVLDFCGPFEVFSIARIGRELVDVHGKDILNEIAKLHFKTTEAILQS